MKKLHFGKKEDTKWFMAKGFYIALALSLIAIGVASYIAVDMSMTNLKNEDEANKNSLNNTSEVNQVDKNQSGVPYASSSNTQNTSSSNSSSSNQSNNTVSKPTTSSSEAKETLNNSAQKEVLFAMPLKGEILNKFSNGELVKSKTLGDWRTHNGVDIKAEKGTPVKVIASGTVLDIKKDEMWGATVVVEHEGGYKSIYSGLNENIDIKKDQKLKIGDVIGTVGEETAAESEEGPHFHLELKKDDKFIDPMSVITNP